MLGTLPRSSNIFQRRASVDLPASKDLAGTFVPYADVVRVKGWHSAVSVKNFPASAGVSGHLTKQS